MSDVAPTPETGRIPNKGKLAKDLNEVIRYTLWSVFRLKDVLPEDRAGYADEVQELFDQLAAKDVTVRGTYDVSGLRADADLMIWWHAETSDQLQEAYNLFRRTRLGRALAPVWSNMALHRPAEFNRSHIPAFLADETPRDYVSVYPFVRSYDWYLLPDEDRRRMLADHGKMARGYPDVRANTVASFSLGDYEWILAFEADELYRIVDLMRHLRASEARMHVREEVPFYTGRRRSVAELVAACAPLRQPPLQQVRLQVAVDATVGPPADPVVAGVPLGHQYRPPQPPVQGDRPFVRCGRVPLGRQDQRGRQLTGTGPHVERPLTRTRPVRARQVRPHVVPRLEGRGARQPRVVAVPDPPLGGPGAVVALDGRVDGARVLLLDGRLLRGRTGDLHQRFRIALQVGGQGQGTLRPVVVVVRGLEERPVQLSRPHPAPGGPGRQSRRRPLVAAQHLLGGVAQPVHRVVPGGPGPEVRPASLERGRLVEVVAVPDLLGVRVHHRVEHHPAYVGGEQGGVQRPEVGAVRRSHEGEPRLAESGAQDVEVAGVVEGVVVPQRAPAPPGTAARERLGPRDAFLLVRLRGVRRRRRGSPAQCPRVPAGQRRRAADPARGVPDEVVGGAEPLPVREEAEQREEHPRGPRAARIEHERALPGHLPALGVLALGPDPADGQ